MCLCVCRRESPCTGLVFFFAFSWYVSDRFPFRFHAEIEVPMLARLSLFLYTLLFFLLPPARRGYVFFNNIISLIIRCVVICFPLSSGGVSSVVVYVLSLPPSPSSSRCSQKNHFTLFTLPGGKGKGCC